MKANEFNQILENHQVNIDMFCRIMNVSQRSYYLWKKNGMPAHRAELLRFKLGI